MKKGFCPMHCPRWTFWLFGLLALWYTLSAFGLSVYGSFWSWLVLLVGICTWVCTADPKHKKSECPFAGLPVWVGIVTTIVGAWFVLGDVGVLSTYGLNLLYVAFLLAFIYVWQLRK